METLPKDINLERQLNNIDKSLETCQSVVEKWEIKKKIEVLKQASLVISRRDIAIKCGQLICKAEFQIAKHYQPGEKGRGKKGEDVEGVTKRTIRDIREVYSDFTQKEFESKIKHFQDINIIPTREGFRKSTPRSFSGRFEYYSPITILNAARRCVGGQFDLDPASCAEANEKVKAKEYYTIKDDGLKQDWGKDKSIWLNPPFTNLRQFALKFVSSAKRGFFLGRCDPSCVWCYIVYSCSTCAIYIRDRGRKTLFTIPGGKGVRPIECPLLFAFGIKKEIVIQEFLKEDIDFHFAEPLSVWVQPPSPAPDPKDPE